MIERDVAVPGGGTVAAFDTGGDDDAAVVWHHGTPQTGRPLAAVVAAARARGLRVVAYGRPGYGSPAVPGRDVAAAAADTAAVADAFGVQRFAALGASGGGPHALACAARLGDRVPAVVCFAGIAPRTDAFDWWDGMVAPGGLRAAAEGRAARTAHLATEEFDPASFVDRDWEALADRWSDLGADAGRAGETGAEGLVDDDVAFAAPWGFDLAEVTCPALFVQGGRDRVVPPAHAAWQSAACPHGERWERPRDGHVSVLDAVPVALDWVLDAWR